MSWSLRNPSDFLWMLTIELNSVVAPQFRTNQVAVRTESGEFASDISWSEHVLQADSKHTTKQTADGHPICFTLRTHYRRSWSPQWSLPGGEDRPIWSKASAGASCFRLAADSSHRFLLMRGRTLLNRRRRQRRNRSCIFFGELW